MQYVLSRYLIKAGKQEETRRFLQKLHLHRQSEMQAVLKEAGMSLDCSFIGEEDGRAVLLIFKRLNDQTVLQERIAHSHLPIYTEIRRWAAECLEMGGDVMPIATFDLCK